MDTRVRKSQSLYDSSYILILFIVLCAGLGVMTQSDLFYISIFALAIILIISHFIYVKRLKKLLTVLIEMTENIIDPQDKEFPIIDGESYIAVLATHLHTLQVRMKGMIDQLASEQNHLKDYIEDISHQIKTPLTSMFLKEDILLETCEGISKHYVEQIIVQTQRIHSYIESLLHLAQIESHSVTYHFQNYEFSEIISAVEKNLQILLEQNQVSIELHQDAMIYCDFHWLSEAFSNIIKNSIEQKSHSTIDISCENHPSFINISIQDHGPGIAKKDLPYIFQRFYHNEYQKKESIGIGLSIVEGIIKDHHGTISAYNHQGALFVITLPHKKTKTKYRVTNE